MEPSQAIVRTLPVAEISRSKIRENLAREADLSREHGVPAIAVGAELDALGHGAALVAQLASEAGFVAVTVSDGVQQVVAPPGAPAAPCAPGAPGAPAVVMTSTVPVRRVVGAERGTSAAMRLTGEILSVKVLRAGESVSYGYTFTAPHDTQIALVTGGYAQGIVRSLGNRLTVSVAGERRPIVGRVAMDACVVDLGTTGAVRGDAVVFLGDAARHEPTILEWAEITNMQPEELLAGIGLRAQRVVVA